MEVKMDNLSQSQFFKPTRNIALWTSILLTLVLMLETVNIVINLTKVFLASKYPETVEASLLQETSDFTDMPGGVTQAAVEMLTLSLVFFGVIGYIITVVAFLIWMHRSYSNLEPLGIRNPEYSPTWAVGCWFVPFMNLVRPYNMIKEIWDRSDPDKVETEGTPSASALEMTQIATPMFGLWWGVWIISNVFTNVSARYTLRANSLQQFVVTFWSDIVSSVFTIAAAILAIGVVRAISARQEERYKRMASVIQPPAFSYNTPPAYRPSDFA
jgi:hypothetical protein